MLAVLRFGAAAEDRERTSCSSVTAADAALPQAVSLAATGPHAWLSMHNKQVPAGSILLSTHEACVTLHCMLSAAALAEWPS